MSKPEYPIHNPETSPFSQRLEVRLLARTQSPLPIEDFSATEWAEINAAAVLAGEAAKTCYSPELLTPLDFVRQKATDSEKKFARHRASVLDVAASTRASGHHSTREHTHYVFGIKNVSRRLIYRLHSQPNHVSDQESQRYVPMSAEGLVLPRVHENPEASALIESAAAELFTGYEQLTALLFPIVRELYLKRFPGKRQAKWTRDVETQARNKSQEIGRYLLPLSMGANLYHSINELTLIRMAKMASGGQYDAEMYLLVKSMVNAVAALDPTILEEIGVTLSDNPSFDAARHIPDFSDAYAAANEFDNLLGGLPIRLDGDMGQLDRRLADAVRLTVGASSQTLSDADALAKVLDPSQNPLLASVDGEMVMDQLSRALNQVSYSAGISISHVIDSQLQRHRAIAHTAPIHLPVPRLERDIVVPGIVSAHPEALELYLRIQARNIAYMEQLAGMANVDEVTLSYLHTNATRIRKRINAPLGALHHYLRLRTCLNAQEENYRIAVALTRQLPTVSPLIAFHFDKPAPCGVRIRAGATPICPEGDHFCGVPIWKKTIAEYPDRDI